MLIEIKKFLQTKQQASLQELCYSFSITPDFARNLLKHYIIKGKIHCFVKKPKCGTVCNKCDLLMTEIYQWVEYA